MKQPAKLTLASPSFAAQPYDISLEYYHGKDIVHEGSLLVLDPDQAWSKVSTNTRRIIRKVQQLKNLRIDRVKGTKAEVAAFRTIWFDPEDVTIPPQLDANEIMYLAYLDDELVAGMILTPAGNNLFMHNLGGNDQAKTTGVTSYLLWHAVNDLQETDYGYIDIGASFRKPLQTYFRHWSTASYPIIFEPPFIKPAITLSPFTAQQLATYKNRGSISAKPLEAYFGNEFTILPRAMYAIKALLMHLDIKADENVAIYKTLDNEYISRCVTSTIESRCKWMRKIDAKTKAVMVIHEFGYPYKDLRKLKAECEKRGLPLIENCAWGYGSKVDGQTIGTVGDYAIYSLGKFLPIAYGAVVTGLSISDEDNWNNYRLLDYYKREIITQQLLQEMPKIDQYHERQRANWRYLKELFGLAGNKPLIELDDEVYPATFLVKLDNYQRMFEKYAAFGVETGRYYPEEALFLPVNASLDEPQLDYMYGIYHGYLNLCSDYRREA